MLLGYFGLGAAVCVCGSHTTIREFPHPCAIREQNILLPIGKLDGLDARLLNSLNCSIREDALLFPILEDAFNRTIRKSKLCGKGLGGS